MPHPPMRIMGLFFILLRLNIPEGEEGEREALLGPQPNYRAPGILCRMKSKTALTFMPRIITSFIDTHWNKIRNQLIMTSVSTSSQATFKHDIMTSVSTSSQATFKQTKLQ